MYVFISQILWKMEGVAVLLQCAGDNGGDLEMMVQEALHWLPGC